MYYVHACACAVGNNVLLLLMILILQGVVASGIAFAVQIWCIDKGGPVFVAVYQPVQTLIVAIMASLALGEEFYLGGFVAPIYLTFLYLIYYKSYEYQTSI